MASRYQLQDCEQKHREVPRTFSIPRGEIRRALEPGWLVKLVFELPKAIEGCSAEKMWVEVLRREGAGYVGRLTNQPRYLAKLAPSDDVLFQAAHVAGIEKRPDPPRIGMLLGVGVDVLRNDAWPAWIAKGEATKGDSGWRVFSEREAEAGATVRGVSTSTLFRAFAVTDSAIDADEVGVFHWDTAACEYVRAAALPERLREAAASGLGRSHKPMPDAALGCVVTRRVVDEAPTLAQRVKPLKSRPEDSGWSLLVGDESQDYVDDTRNSMIMYLSHLVHRYPYLERVLGERAAGMWCWNDAGADWERVRRTNSSR